MGVTFAIVLTLAVSTSAMAANTPMRLQGRVRKDLDERPVYEGVHRSDGQDVRDRQSCDQGGQCGGPASMANISSAVCKTLVNPSRMGCVHGH